MMYLDLSELDEVLRLSRLWSTRRFSLARFRRADYFTFPADTTDTVDSADFNRSDCESRASSLQNPVTQSHAALSAVPSIDESVRKAVENKLNFRPSGAIRVLTNFRYFGYLINPITCYYCFDESEHLQALLIEVTNTPWGQRTHYVLDLRQYQPGESIDFNKDMHVSPFMPMSMIYRWKGSAPGEKLVYSLASFALSDATADTAAEAEDQNDHSDIRLASVGDTTTGNRQFDSGVNFKRIEITSASLNRVLWQYPWMSGKVALAIYWQALKLWLKRIPFVPHPNKAGAK